MEKSLVSIVIVSCGANDYLMPCLDSVSKQAYISRETILIDNSGNFSFAGKIKSLFPTVKVYTSAQNLSFCASLNVGLNLSRGDFNLCLNDDVTLEPGFISEALKAFVNNKVGIVSGKILRIDKVSIDSTGLFLSPWRAVKERGYGAKEIGQFNNPGYVFGVCGAAAFYRREMLEDIKQGSDYFDSDFGFFYEDLDIAWRAQNKGWEGYYVPAAIAYHARGGTARQKKGIGKKFARFYISEELQFDLIKNRYLTVIKNETLLGFLLHLPFMLIYDVAVFGFLVLFRRKVIPKLFSLPKFMKSAFRKRLADK